MWFEMRLTVDTFVDYVDIFPTNGRIMLEITSKQNIFMEFIFTPVTCAVRSLTPSINYSIIEAMHIEHNLDLDPY